MHKRQLTLNKLFFEHAGICYWCKRGTNRIQGAPRQATIDHLKTKAMGRESFSDGGYVLACQECNGDRNHEEVVRLKAEKRKALLVSY